MPSFNKLLASSVVIVFLITSAILIVRLIHHHKENALVIGDYYYQYGDNGEEWKGLPGYRGPWPSCPKREPKREIYATLLLTDEYTETVLKLACSMKNVNATRPLIVFYDKKEILKSNLEIIQNAGIETRSISEIISFPNSFAKRFSINWTKLLFWKMEEFTRILYLDADMFMLRNVDHLFDYKEDFIVAADADRFVSSCSPFGFNQAGLFVMSPCKEVFDHMFSMIKHNKSLQFRHSDAEQGFLNFYYQYNRLLLSPSYNFLAYKFWDTPMRQNIMVIHYTANKPFHIKKKEDVHEYHQPWLQCDTSKLSV